MKFPLFLLAVLSPLALAAPPKAPAKTAAKSSPKPAVKPVAAAEPAASADLDAGVKIRIEGFFKLLKENKIDDGYAKLFEGSTLAKEQPELLTNLVKNTERVIEKCGRVDGASILRVRSAGRTLKEVVCIANCQKRPIRWLIYAYYGEGRWQVLDTDVDLELDSFFEPVKPAAR